MNLDKQRLFLIIDDYKGDQPFFAYEAQKIREKYELTIVCLGKKEIVSESIADRVVFLDYSMKKSIKYIWKFPLSAICREEARRIFRDDGTSKQKIRRLISSVNYFSSGIWFYKLFCKEISANFDGSIIYTFWCNYALMGILLNKNNHSRCRYVSRIHRYELYDEANPSGRQPFKWFINRNIDKLVFIGKNPQDYYLNKHKDLHLEKVELCRLGVKKIEIQFDYQPQDAFILVSCSNVIPVKRVELIVKALAEYEGAVKVHWIHFGDGLLLDELRRLAIEKLANKENIIYELRGHVENRVIRSFYASTGVDGFITTSSSEGCPVSIMEAMSVGTPIIGTAVGDIPYMINGNGILLSENPEVKEIADAIKSVVNCYSVQDIKNNYIEMRTRSKELFAELFDAKRNTKRFIDLVLENGGR